jgi:hypothetical protein
MTSFTDEVRETVSPHKFGGDRMAAALYLLSLDSGQDEATGDAVDWEVWAARFGRRILICDGQGFVYQTAYKSEEIARKEFALIDAEYAKYADEEGF